MHGASHEIDVLIVGAGPTGLVAASQLIARGIRVRLIEKLPTRSDKSRALIVHARSLELLQKMRIADDLVSRGKRAMHIYGMFGGREVIDLEVGDTGVDDTPYPFVLFASQAETEAVLDAHLAALGGVIERERVLVSASADGYGVTARVAQPDGTVEIVHCAYILGCDGAHSVVRKSAGMSFEGEAYPQDFVLADVKLEWARDPNALHIFLTDQGPFAIFPLNEPGLVRLVASRGELPAAGAPEPTLEDFQALANEVSPYPMRLYDPRWITRFRLHHRGVDRYRAGRMFVAGDAAHIHSPAGGQGMNTGIQDAYNLAWKLALVIQGRAGDELLDSYHDERHPVGQRLLKFTDRAFAAGASRNPLLIAARNFLGPRVGPLVMRDRKRRGMAFRFLSQLGIDYGDSPIVGEDAAGADRAYRNGPRPGFRAPDSPLDGTTLFELLVGTPHHLVLFGNFAESPSAEALRSEAARIIAPYGDTIRVHFVSRASTGAPAPHPSAHIDSSGLAHERYGVTTGACYLVRPDGYIAFRSYGTDLRPAVGYLERMFNTGLHRGS